MSPVAWEVLTLAIVVLVIGTQVVVPAWNGSPLWPLFRYRKVVRKVDDARVAYDIARAEMEAMVTTIKAGTVREQTTTKEQAWHSRTDSAAAASVVDVEQAEPSKASSSEPASSSSSPSASSAEASSKE